MQLLCISINLTDFLKQCESLSKQSLWEQLQKTSHKNMMFELSPIAIWKKKKRELMDWLSVCPQLFVLFRVNSLFLVSVFLLLFFLSVQAQWKEQSNYHESGIVPKTYKYSCYYEWFVLFPNKIRFSTCITYLIKIKRLCFYLSKRSTQHVCEQNVPNGGSST